MPGYPAMPGSSDVILWICLISVWIDCIIMISGPVRSPLRSDLYYFRRFLFYRFCLLVFNFKKLKRSDWISNSRASNFRIGFPSWRRTKRGGWCTLVHWDWSPPLLPPYHHYNFLDFNQRKFLLRYLTWIWRTALEYDSDTPEYNRTILWSIDKPWIVPFNNSPV